MEIKILRSSLLSLNTKRRELEAGLLNNFQSLRGSRSALNASLPNSNQLRRKIFYSTYIDSKAFGEI
jgi:hypothetical protein